MFQLMKKDARAVSTSCMEGHLSLSHQRLQLDHKKATDVKHYSSPESNELLHLEHLEILKFSYKTNNESTQIKDKFITISKTKH